ncbi:type 1 glutamine amidotransferase domain-containing protein [Bdellovibrio sp. SKB1291214]|uniref:type 1 glutamine amidotransferase domain-containing protein n=1 Tax=Bdellovibrio sp. SKB1291214 TaxID=1732569 RepID=UPI0020CC4A9C|nr:type 1 glutamine amidotransferase domain-containing protein [Bdellovibrio sp. SKB1291214]UYL07844.1 type 1 glutamine amidotransferase domain-containing protein [Bdellovibrio sp. SKB1291214]
MLKTINALIMGWVLTASFAEAKTKRSDVENRALIVISSHSQLGETGKPTGWYLSEVTHVYYPLAAAGYQVDFASPQGGAAPMDPGSREIKDEDNKKFLADPGLMKQVQETLPLSKVDPKKYRLVHFAGGHGAMWDFPNNKDISRVAAAIYENDGIVSAVCHGPAALVDIKLSNGEYLIKGKRVNGFTNAEESEVGLTKVVPFLLASKLQERGANYEGGKNWEDKVVVDGRLVTGQNPQSAHSVGRKVVELLQSKK